MGAMDKLRECMRRICHHVSQLYMNLAQHIWKMLTGSTVAALMHRRSQGFTPGKVLACEAIQADGGSHVLGHRCDCKWPCRKNGSDSDSNEEEEVEEGAGNRQAISCLWLLSFGTTALAYLASAPKCFGEQVVYQ